MKILITGANGLLGKELVKKLSLKHNNYALVRNKAVFIENVNIDQQIQIIQSDLYNFNVKILLKDIDVIFYLAQSKRFREFPNGASDIFEININSPFKI